MVFNKKYSLVKKINVQYNKLPKLLQMRNTNLEGREKIENKTASMFSLFNFVFAGSVGYSYFNYILL
jgi:hypothetical protein